MKELGLTPSDLLWRSIEELEGNSQLRELIQREFPSGINFWKDTDIIHRRHFLKIMGASVALAGLNGCLWFTPEEVVPYVEAPENIIPDQPLSYATSHIQGGFAKGILATTYMARPTKIEGNSEHPASLGGSDVFMQGFILQLYDPERGKTPLYLGNPSSWDEFYTHLARDKFPMWNKTAGKGLRILTDTVSSPTLAALIRELISRYPQMRWYQYEPVNRDPIYEGTLLAFGKPLNPLYRLNQARIILSLGSDFMHWGPGSTRFALEFADQRRLRPEHPTERPIQMNRLYIAESDFSITGASADHRLAVKPSRIELLTRTLASKLGLAFPPSLLPVLESSENIWISKVAQDLSANPGKCIVIPGDDQPASVHAIAHWINQKLGAAGSTVVYQPPLEAHPVNQTQSLVQLIQEMKNGEVESLFIMGTNPVYTAPANLNFREHLSRVPFRYCHDEYPNETSFYCNWYLPNSHGLESWGDALAYDGTVSFQQPVVAPLYQSKTSIEVISALLGRPGALGRDILKNYWSKHWKDTAGPHKHRDFESFWQRTLHDGFIQNSIPKPVNVWVKPDLTSRLTSWHSTNSSKSKLQNETDSFEINFKPDPRIWDGRYRANAWLQELPKPLTQLTWDNAAIMSPQTARLLDVKNEDCVKLQIGESIVQGAVFVLPGHADGVITAYLGYGSIAPNGIPHSEPMGFNAYTLRTTEHLWFGQGLRVSKLQKQYPLAFTQHHQMMGKALEGRDLIAIGNFADYQVGAEKILWHKYKKLEQEKPLSSLYSEFPYPSEAWAMVIDLTVCIGCKVCTIACQAENNIPVVGKHDVRNHREMHWIRVDRYFYGSPENPQAAFQPVPCMHCQQAPCEYVCPTEATTHDSSGLNQMIYNRCIGTRDCSNNCPYKVRRFNFLQYSEMKDPLKRLVYNPTVTVREYGVMEKCTYCIQRISRARIESGKENRSIRAGEVRTACQAACPTRAISFGDKNNPNEEVTRLKKHPLNYGILEEVGTQPRTTYLARIKNPNPEMEQT